MISFNELNQEQRKISLELSTLLREEGLSEKAEELEKRLSDLESREKINVAFIGQYSAGKSSIISALTNEDVAIGTDVTTENATEYNWGAFLVTDTPGLQNNQDHDEKANEAIKNADLIVYCITYELFNRYTLEDYLNLAYTKGYANKMILVINKINSEECDDRNELIKIYTDSLNRSLAPHRLDDVPYCFIDVQDYIKGKKRGKESRIIKSNFQSFISMLNEFLSNKGYFYKLDTPMCVTKTIIDEVFIDESESEDEKKLKEIIRRVNRDIENKRTSAIRRWNGVVADCLTDCQTKMNSLFDKAQCGDTVDVNLEFEKLLNEQYESISQALGDFGKVVEDECEEITSKMKSSYTFKSLFDGVNISGNDKILDVDLIDSENKKDKSSINADAVKKVGETIKGVAGGINPDKAYKVVKGVGHFFGHKFKPWGIVRTSGKLTKFVKNAGPVLAVVGAVLDFKESRKEKKEAKEQVERRREWGKMVKEISDQIRADCDTQLMSFVDCVFTARLNELENIHNGMLEAHQKNQDFNLKLEKFKDLLSGLQNQLLVSNAVDNASQEV